MSLTDTIGGALGRLASSDVAAKLLDLLSPAMIQTAIDRLNAAGFGQQINSWFGKGPNEPITTDELRQALGNAKLQEIGKSLGLPVDKLAEILAQHLPAAAAKAAELGIVRKP